MSRPNRSPSKRSVLSPRTSNSEEISKRIASPSPSARHVSSRRIVNVERQPLLDRNNYNSDCYTASNLAGHISSHPLNDRVHKNDSMDVESINYKGISMTNNPSSIKVVNNTDLSPNSYTPAATTNIENLEWNDIMPYYLPCLSWIKHYSPSFFMGDLMGGLTLVFFQLPLSLSYATSLAHVPVVCGLYSLGISPLIYLIFGSVPQMVVGPEGPISLIVGQAVEPLLHHSKKKNLDPMEFVVAITFVSGASLLGFGLGRFGFLDNVLCASLLKGFICGVGIVMVINSLVVMLGLSALLKEVSSDPSEMDIHSPFDKLLFVIHNYDKLHSLTVKISMIGLVSILLARFLKKVISSSKNKYLNKIILIPEILLVVGISTYLCSSYQWHEKGIKIIGAISNDGSFKLYNPISPKMFTLIKKLSTSGFLCAMLGFFESTTASKSLGSTYDLPISSNRELVALGFINIVCSIFGALPAFGGYGRSKMNAISAKTTMSGAIMGFCTLFTVTYLLDYLYYVPVCMLSTVTAVIGLSLIEEGPYEIYFHWRSKGYNELITFGVTVLTTIFFSIEAGIAVGLVYSLIRVIKHSAESRIQILGRYPGTNTFLDADISISKLQAQEPQAISISLDLQNSNTLKNISLADFEEIKYGNQKLDFFSDNNVTHLNTHVLEEIEGCLIIKIPEPLTFANTSDLRARLKRVEMYGSTRAHPASKRTRDESMTKYIIFDLNDMTELDSSAAQILYDLIKNYRDRNIHSFFVRVHKNKKLRNRLEDTRILDLLLRDLEEIKYFDVQTRLAFNRMRRRRSANDVTPGIGIENDTDMIPIDVDESSEIYDLTESPDLPYFNHITDALKVIDYYELNYKVDDVDVFLEVDQIERRSSLPNDEIV